MVSKDFCLTFVFTLHNRNQSQYSGLVTFLPTPLFSLTPLIYVDVLLTDDEQSGVKVGEDKAVVAGLPEVLNPGGVGDAGNGDAIGLLGGRTQRFGHLLLTHAPVGGHEGRGAQEVRQKCLDKGEARGAHPLHECHRARV